VRQVKDDNEGNATQHNRLHVDDSVLAGQFLQRKPINTRNSLGQCITDRPNAEHNLTYETNYQAVVVGEWKQMHTPTLLYALRDFSEVKTHCKLKLAYNVQPR